MSKGDDTQPELPLPSEEPQEAARSEEVAHLLQIVISTVTTLGACVEALSGKQEASTAAITNQQTAVTEDLGRQIGIYSADMRKVLADLRTLQNHIDGGDYRQTMRDDIRTHVGQLKEEVGFLSSALDSHIEKFGAINQEARKVIEAARSTQSEANRSLKDAKDFVRGKTRFVVLILFVVVILSGWAGYLAAMKFETDTGTWAHQLKKAWTPTFLCSEMGFQVERGTEGASFCVSRLNTKR